MNIHYPMLMMLLGSSDEYS